eukprot:7378258-Prymnesium_polylepis.1
MKALFKRRRVAAAAGYPPTLSDHAEDSVATPPRPEARGGAAGSSLVATIPSSSRLAAHATTVEEPETNMAGERRRVHPRRPQVHLPDGQPDAALEPGGSSAAAPVPPTPAEGAAPPPPVNRVRAAELRERAESMLLGDGERPRASPPGGVVSESTNSLLIDARYAILRLWSERQDDIRAACAPQQIDEMDCYGYLLADILGRPLLHADDAGDVGRRAHVQQGRSAAKWKKEQRDGEDAVRRARTAAAAKPELVSRIAAAEMKHAQ